MGRYTTINSSLDDEKEADRYALPLEVYLSLKQEKNLHLSIPREECTCGYLDGVFSSLLAQYNVDDLLTIRNPEYKKGKELFLVCLFAYIIRESDNKNHQYDICLPLKDRGTDAYVREIDRKNSLIIHHPIQICEMPEKYLNQKERLSNPVNWVFNFIKKTKLKHYPKSADALLVWLEFNRDYFLNIANLRQLLLNQTTIPFSQIVIMGRGKGDFFIVCSVYSRNSENDFCFQYNYKNKEVLGFNIV